MRGRAGYDVVDRVFEVMEGEFTCALHGPDAMGWLDANRPDVAAAVRMEEGVASTEAADVVPAWDADGSGSHSGTSTFPACRPPA